MPTNPYMTVREVAQELDMTTDGVYKLIRREKLPAIRASERGLRVSRRALDAYRRRLRGDTLEKRMTIVYGPPDSLEKFERDTGLPLQEWYRRWRTEEIEDTAENMATMLRCTSLLLDEQELGPAATG